MSKEELKKLFVASFAVTGWTYAIMLTRREIFDVWQGIPWYTILILNVMVFGIFLPLTFWAWISSRRRSAQTEKSSDVDTRAQGQG